MKTWKKWLLLLLVVGGGFWGRTAFFIVQETESAIRARFNRPLADVYRPGLHLKAPWPIDKVFRFDKRLLVFKHTPTEFLTADKKNVLVDCFAVWRIADEQLFLSVVRNREKAEFQLLTMITSAMGEVVGKYELSSFINTDTSKVLLNEIDTQVLRIFQDTARRDYGLDVVDVRINALNFPVQNRAAVIKRMRAEREKIATKYRSEGEEEAMLIEADTEEQTRKLLADARSEAEKIRGEGEAAAIRIYGQAQAQDPEFYRFLRTLEAYDRIVDKDTTIVLRSDSPLWRMLEEGTP